MCIFRIPPNLHKTHHRDPDRTADPQTEQKRKHRRTSCSVPFYGEYAPMLFGLCGDHFFAVP